MLTDKRKQQKRKIITTVMPTKYGDCIESKYYQEKNEQEEEAM